MDEVEKAHSDTLETTPDLPRSETQDINTTSLKEKLFQAPSTSKRMKGMRKKLLIILAIIFLLALTTATVFLLRN